MQQVYSSLPSVLIIHSREAFIRGVAWAFFGILYAMLFVIFAALAEEWKLSIHPYLFSGILASTIGALIYSSIRQAVFMALIISPVCAVFMLYSSTPISPLNLLFILGAIGAIAGGLFSRYIRDSHVYRVDAKILSGFTAGLLASVVCLLLFGQFPDLPLGLVIGMMCLLTGLIYISLVPRFIHAFGNLLSPLEGGALVGIGVAVFLTLCNFVMVHSIEIDSTGTFYYLIQNIQGLLPEAILGSLIGGGFAGILSSLFSEQW